MLEISLKNNINNIAYLLYMEQQEQKEQKKVNVKSDSLSREGRPPQAKDEI